jgi:large subunit ribosomal protein L2
MEPQPEDAHKKRINSLLADSHAQPKPLQAASVPIQKVEIAKPSEIKPETEKLARGAGVFAQVVANDGGYTNIKMPSTEVRKISENCYACIGEVSNSEYKLQNFGKAGRSRWKGIRPTVRGSAMNPVDHPYGGGEGAQGRGTRRAKTMWGKPSGKGQKTRTPKKYSNMWIVSRRKVGKNKNAK